MQQYRPDIDGLRAIAVGLVIGFHAFPSIFPGGFVGVDIFFVISGYLITGIIKAEISSGSFSVGSFYGRRIRRIFPALILVLLATYAAGWRFLTPDELKQLGVNTIAGGAFFANASLLMQSGYFDIEAARKPLLHLWSLGIEEQFYIFWPLLLMLIGRARWIVTLGIISFALNLFLIKSYPEATFYLPFTRAWELLAGAALVYLKPGARWDNLISIVGAIMIASAVLLLTSKTPYPGWAALLPVAGTVALILSRDSLFNLSVLSWRPFVLVGLISYPLYLWHWPLIVYATMALGALDIGVRLSLIAACVALSIATYLFWEIPLRSGNHRKTKAVSLSFAIVAIISIGIITVQGNGMDWRFPPEVRGILTASVQADRWRVHECSLVDGDVKFSDKCVDQLRPLVFLWGDSTSSALSPGLLDLQKKLHFGLAQFSLSSCEPSAVETDISRCAEWNRQAWAALKATRPDTVLLEAIWYPADDRMNDLVSTIEAIKNEGVKRIVVIGRVPVWSGGIKQQIIDFYKQNSFTLPTRLYQAASEKVYDDKMRSRLSPLGVVFISAWDALCNTTGCIVRLPDASGKMELSTTDTLHLSEAGSLYLASSLVDKLFRPD